MTDSASIPDSTRIGHVVLAVTDLDRMTEFYRDVVGLGVVDRTDDRAVLGAGGAELIVLEEDPGAGERPIDAAGLFHLAVRVPSRAALADALERVNDAGRLLGASDHAVSEALYLSDPEGNGIELYHDRPRSAWEQDDEGHVAMPTERLDLADLSTAAAGDDEMPDGTTIGHVHLEVTDLSASRRFYADTLGLQVRQALGGALFLAADDYHHHVGLNTWNGRTAPASGRGLDRFELVVPGETVEELRERCENEGYDVVVRDAGFAVTDPDGILLHIRP